MKKEDLSAKFTPYIQARMMEGFYISMTELTGSYSGSFGHQVLLAKGRERIVCWMERDTYLDESMGYYETVREIHLFIARFELAGGETTEWHYEWPKDWKEHLVSEEVLYEVERDEWYVTDKFEYLDCRVKQRRRRHDRAMDASHKLTLTNDLLNIVRRIPGFKKVNRDLIVVERKEWRYVITNNKSGKKHFVHIGA